MSLHPSDITPDFPDPDAVSPVKEGSRISQSLCDSINRYYDASDEHSISETAERFGLHETTVERHLDAIAYKGPCKQHGGVDVHLCSKLRLQYGEASYGDLAAEYDLNKSTVQYHVRGKCGHD